MLPLQPSFVSLPSTSSSSDTTRVTSTSRFATPRDKADNKDQDVGFLLKEFLFYNGEVLDPYQTLKVPRQADARAIKQAYRRQSRLYHPDAARHRDILPGACNNQEQVREQWERINWSYDLLSDATRRRKYDRHEALADPARALRRAAVQAAWSGVTTVGQGLWNVGSAAVTNIMAQKEAKVVATVTTTSGSSGRATSNGASTIVEYKRYPAGFQPSGLQQDVQDLERLKENNNINKMPIVVPVKES